MAERRKKAAETDDIRDAAGKIWMAGIGALRTAEEEGSRLFKALYEKGMESAGAGRKAGRKPVERVLREAIAGGVGSVREKIDDLAGRGEDLWEKLGVEDVLASVLQKTGVATKNEMDLLNRKIDALGKAVRTLQKERRPGRPAANRKASASASRQPAAGKRGGGKGPP